MNESTGKLILRVTLGFLILLHGYAKVKSGTSFIGGALEASGLPAFFQYGVYMGEVLAPILLIAGFYARIGAWLVAVNMLFAIGLVHWGEVFAFNEGGALALEMQYMYMAAAIALALIGPGRYAVNQK